MYRQGDILLIPVDGVSGNARTTENLQQVIVAEGEATGHYHILTPAPFASVSEHVITQDEVDVRFIEIMAANGMTGAKLTHDEHATITIPPGIYEVRRQREYEPEQNRYVAD